jgi:nucleoid-associated protein YgaU
MAMYKDSRYTNVFAYEEIYKGKEVFAFYRREIPKFDLTDAVQYTVIEKDRLDLLAGRFYGDPQLWWAILDANPQYMFEWEITPGTVLAIPDYEQVRRIVANEPTY